MPIDYEELKITSVCCETAKALNELMRQLSPRSPEVTPASVKKSLRSNSRIFVAKDDEKIVGVATLCSTVPLDGQRDRLEGVVVDKDHQRQHIGETLVLRAISESRKHGARDLTLVTEPDLRPGVVEFYIRLGFIRRDDKKTFRLTH